MKILNEAIVGQYHFVVSDDYLNISMEGKELVHLSFSEAQEVVPWVYDLLGRFNGTSAVIIPIHTLGNTTATPAAPYVNLPSSDNLSKRSAQTTAPIKVGDPFLANSGPMASSDGKQKIFGITGEDLGATMAKAGIPILRK